MKNLDAMNRCVETVMDILSGSFTVTKTDSKYEQLKLNAFMKFETEQYQISGLGNLLLMTMNMGIMQMLTIVLTPFEKDLPILSTDFIYVLGNRKSYIELYDVLADRPSDYDNRMAKYLEEMDKYRDIPDLQPSQAWYEHLLTARSYKSAKAHDDERLIKLACNIFKIYVEQANSTEVLSQELKEIKKSKVKEYSDGLVLQGGVSTDVFKKKLGEETTIDFFDSTFFGSSNA